MASEIIIPRPTARNMETWKVVFISVAEYDFAAYLFGRELSFTWGDG